MACNNVEHFEMIVGFSKFCKNHKKQARRSAFVGFWSEVNLSQMDLFVNG